MLIPDMVLGKTTITFGICPGVGVHPVPMQKMLPFLLVTLVISSVLFTGTTLPEVCVGGGEEEEERERE